MRTILSIIALTIFMSGIATADPPQITDGANPASGINGTIGEELFNGELRLTVSELRNANAGDDLTAAGGKKWLVLTANASNGTGAALDMQQLVAVVADAQGVTFQAQPDKVRPTGGVFGVPPGGQWKEQIYFDVPAPFVPAEIVLSPYDGKHQAFRVTVPAPTPVAMACPQGYVWREASPTDHVCVTPAQRTIAAQQNASAGGRVSQTDRTYGPSTCKQGYVWREAYSGDIVCVTPSERDDAAKENANAPPQILVAVPVVCADFISDPGFVLQQSNGWTIYFEGNDTRAGNNHGRYNPRTHGAYALDARGRRVIDGTITYLNTTDENDIEFRFDWADQILGAQYRIYTLRMAHVGTSDPQSGDRQIDGPKHYRMLDMHSHDPLRGDLDWWPIAANRFRCGAERHPYESDPNKVYDAIAWVTD